MLYLRIDSKASRCRSIPQLAQAVLASLFDIRIGDNAALEASTAREGPREAMAKAALGAEHL